jgi:hypothetical protein
MRFITLCAHNYTPLPLFAALVSRIITIAIPYDDRVVRANTLVFRSHLAHVRVRFDYWITILSILLRSCKQVTS